MVKTPAMQAASFLRICLSATQREQREIETNEQADCSPQALHVDVDLAARTVSLTLAVALRASPDGRIDGRVKFDTAAANFFLNPGLLSVRFAVQESAARLLDRGVSQ